MSKRYLYCAVQGSKLYHRYLDENDKQKADIITNFDFALYSKTPEETGFKSIYGDNLKQHKFKSVYEMRKFSYDNKDNEIFGFNDASIQYLYKNYKDTDFSSVDPYKNYIVMNFDIETESNKGFPDPMHQKRASSTSSAMIPNPKFNITPEVISISTKIFGEDKRVTFGRVPYTKQNPQDEYYYCTSEVDLYKKFVAYVYKIKPNALTGWNCDEFDVAYFLVRGLSLSDVGEEVLRYISPFAKDKSIKFDQLFYRNKRDGTFSILGITILDYMNIYKKFQLKEKLESYTLEFVGQYEGVGGKLDYSKYGTMHNFYVQNPQSFIEYNERDVEVVEKIDLKRGYLKIALIIAYFGLGNIDSFASPVRMWDNIIHRFASDRNMIIPPKIKQEVKNSISGGFVREAVVGYHEWVTSFDLTSLYPMLIIQYNISPETMIDDINIDIIEEMLYDLGHGVMTNPHILSAHERNLTIAANGSTYTKEFKGIIPSAMQQQFDNRKRHKSIMLKAKAEYEDKKDTASDNELAELMHTIHINSASEQAIKILINAGYGATLEPNFRYFKVTMGEAITKTGRMTIRGVGNATNYGINKLCNFPLNKDNLVAGDTDSQYVQLHDYITSRIPNFDKLTFNEQVDVLDDNVNKEIVELIAEHFAKLQKYVNAVENKMHMKREVIATKALWRAKKNYAMLVIDDEGVRYHEPKLKTTGIQVVKSDTPMIIRKQLKKDLMTIFDGDNRILLDTIKQFSMEYWSANPYDIANPKGISDIDKWAGITKGVPIHVSAAIAHNRVVLERGLHNEIDLIKNGDKLKYVYLINNNPFNNHVIAVKDEKTIDKLGINEYINRQEMFNKGYLSILETLASKRNFTLDENKVVLSKDEYLW